MRPKRPVRPPPPPPPIPAVVTPEDLAAINTPEVDKLPAYISVGKFQWKPPLPGPKGDTGAAGTPGAPGAPGAPGEPGEPGATVRPIDPPVTTDEIGDGQVTQAKLDPALSLGDRFVWGAEGQTGNPRASADVLYLTDVSADIPYTVFDLSAWVPANAKGVILQLGIFNQAFTSGRAFFRVRTNADQRDALGLGNMVGANSQVANQGIVPLIVGTRSIEYALESVGGPWVATFTLYITVIGYII